MSLSNTKTLLGSTLTTPVVAALYICIVVPQMTAAAAVDLDLPSVRDMCEAVLQCPPIAVVIPDWVESLVDSGRSLGYGIETYVVPCYTILVLLYLTMVYFRNGLQGYMPLPPFLRASHQRHYHHNNNIKNSTRSGSSNSNHGSSHNTKTSATTGSSNDASLQNSNNHNDDTQQPIHLSGSYKLISNDNFDPFLAAQGVPWPLRRAACKVYPIHHLTHTGVHLNIRIDAGVLQTQTDYVIGGGPVETVVRGREFRDEMTYLKENDENKENGEENGRVIGVITIKTAVSEGYEISVTRCLSEDRNTLNMVSTVMFPNEPDKESIVSTQVFERVEDGAKL